MINQKFYRHMHRNNSKYRIGPVSIRNYLRVNFVLDNAQNINSYDDSDFFYLNYYTIVTGYTINLPTNEIIKIPIIKTTDILRKILIHREFMIKHKLKKKYWKKEKQILLNNFLPSEIKNKISDY
jgi:hypothetical protein